MMMLIGTNVASQSKGETDLDGAQQYYGNFKTNIICVKIICDNGEVTNEYGSMIRWVPGWSRWIWWSRPLWSPAWASWTQTQWLRRLWWTRWLSWKFRWLRELLLIIKMHYSYTNNENLLQVSIWIHVINFGCSLTNKLSFSSSS